MNNLNYSVGMSEFTDDYDELEEYDDSVSLTENKEQEYMDEVYDELAREYDSSRFTIIRAIVKILHRMPTDERHTLFYDFSHYGYNLAKDILYPYMVSDVEFLLAEINRLKAELNFADYTNIWSTTYTEVEILEAAIKQFNKERTDRNE